MTTFSEGRHPGEFVMTEANGQRSRESLVIAESQEIEANTILCSVADPAKITAAASAAAGNTGDATIAMGDPAVTSKVKDGRYKGIASAATKVEWEDPDGKKIGTSTHGAAFDGPAKFTITAGDTATEVNDEFYITVTAGPGAFQHVAFDPDSDDPIAGITIYPATTGAGETTKIAAIVRDAEANGNCIAWPEDITADQKTLAIGALADLGIIVRN